MVADMFVSLRGAVAYALITQVWLLVYVAPLCSASKNRPTCKRGERFPGRRRPGLRRSSIKR
eukprot:3560530-Pyramimonas_sp.AAC.1